MRFMPVLALLAPIVGARHPPAWVRWLPGPWRSIRQGTPIPRFSSRAKSVLQTRWGWYSVPIMGDSLVPAGLDDAYALELLRRQDALQAEARRVVADLDLVPLLSRAGRVEQVGSSVSGLMVWRDLDF